MRSLLTGGILGLILASSSAWAAPVQRIQFLPPAQLKGQIAFLRDHSLWVFNPTTKRETRILAEVYGGSEDVDISLDLTAVVTTSRGGGVLVVRPLNGRTPRIFRVHHTLASVLWPRWSPDNQRIAYTLGTAYRPGGPPKYSQEVRVIDANGTGDRHIAGSIDPDGPSASRAVWTHDGKRIAFEYYDGAPDYRDLNPDAKTQQLWANADGTDLKRQKPRFSRLMSAVTPNRG